MDIRLILIQAFVILFAITVHEAAHAWTAMKFGDPTAAALGRASLNPLVHIDPIGTVIFPLLLILFKLPVFGWAKPVPYNPYNLRQPKKGALWISFAGPISNILTAGAAVLLFRILRLAGAGVPENSLLVKPLVGLGTVLYITALINISLAVFNLIPIPPLDGSGILAGILPERAAAKYDKIRPYGFLILVFLMYSRVPSLVFSPILKLIDRLFT
jgi:Zn-dependent protease